MTRRSHPVFRELGRRGARVLLHPTSPACWERTSLGRPRPMIEFLFDTTRTVIDLVMHGTIAANPDMQLIVPHAGAVLPLLADRVAAFATILAPGSRRAARSRPAPLRPRRSRASARARRAADDHDTRPSALRQRLAVHPGAGRRRCGRSASTTSTSRCAPTPNVSSREDEHERDRARVRGYRDPRARARSTPSSERSSASCPATPRTRGATTARRSA